MKALLFSDSHGSMTGIQDAIETEPEISLLVHAGDIQRDVDELLAAYPQIKCEYVLGNNDFRVNNVPFDRVFEFGGKRIFLTHGHRYGVKGGYLRVWSRARELKADVCIFGHTHQDVCEYEDGIWLVNPGSSRLSYAVMDVTDGNIEIEIKKR